MTPTQSKAKCVCGHAKASHYAHSGEHSGSCGVRFGGYLGGCDCTKFVQRIPKKRKPTPAVAQEKAREWPCRHITRHSSGGWEIKGTEMMPRGDWCEMCGSKRPNEVLLERPQAPADSGKK